MVKIFIDRKYNSLLFAGVLLVCFLVSVGVRYQQFETWKKTSAAYFVGERPMMTTLDAPYWLRWAREYNEGTYGQKGGLRDYPENTETFQGISAKELSLPLKYTDPTPASTSSSLSSSSGSPEIRYRDVPLLSFLIAHSAPFFNYNYYLTGTLLIPALASLFILPSGNLFFPDWCTSVWLVRRVDRDFCRRVLHALIDWADRHRYAQSVFPSAGRFVDFAWLEKQKRNGMFFFILLALD